MVFRRDFLKVGGTILAGGLASTGHVAAQESLEKAAFTLYQGLNLQDWTVALGDALYNAPSEPPVDIALLYRLWN